MKDQLERIKLEALAAMEAAASPAALDELRVRYLGKKGELTAVLKMMGKLSAEERPIMGQMANAVRAQLEEKLEKGHVILDIEPVGAFNVRAAYPEATLIFIMPPSREELERRLRSRGDTSPEQIELRLARAAWEMDQAEKYDFTVVNDVVETCAETILNIIAKKAKEE